MKEYHFLDENTELTKSDLIKKYNSLIEDIWLLQHTVRELDDNYELSKINLVLICTYDSAS